MAIRDELKACGGVPLGDGFNQDSFRTHNVIDGVNIANGYCAGVALDWIRRVLQPNNRDGIARSGTTHLDYESPNYGSPAGKTSTVRRMAAAHSGQATAYVSETGRSKLKQRLTALQTEVEQNWGSLGVGVGIPHDVALMLKTVWQIPGDPNSTFSKFNLSLQTAGALRRNEITDLLADLNQMADPQQSAGAAGGRDWTSYASELDTNFRQIRISEARQVTARPFSNLSVVRSSPSTDYASAGAWSATLRTNGLSEGCGTLVSMKPASVLNGHQVAIHQKLPDEFVLFDPNYGSFKCSGASLKNCLQQLFWQPYLNTEGNGNTAKINISGVKVATLDGNLAVYCRRASLNAQPSGAWKAMGYTVFRATG
jgi:hypothetical protein